MKIVAFIPIKLNSVRLKNKNILELKGHPMCWHIADTLLSVDEVDEVYIYCSDDNIVNYLPAGIRLIKRDNYLDGDIVKGADIYKAFIETVDANIYILAHATSPFIKKESIRMALKKVLYGSYDSAYTAKKIQNFAWMKEKPLNYDLDDVPRTQDLEPIWIETSAFFIFKKEVFTKFKRRIGFKPYRYEVKGMEAIDIDTEEDYKLAVAYASLENKHDE